MSVKHIIIIFVFLQGLLVLCQFGNGLSGFLGDVASLVFITSAISTWLKDPGKSAPTNGVFIRHKEGGCLDGGKESLECTHRSHGIGWNFDPGPKFKAKCDWYFTYQNDNLADWPSAKWRFDGPLLVTYVTRSKYLIKEEDEKRCLTFQSPIDVVADYLEVVAAKCKGSKSQRWFLKMYSGQLGDGENHHPKPYFSINSEEFPNKCLTLKQRTQYTHFYKRGGWGDEKYRTAVESNFLDSRPGFNGFFLEECTGCPEQSFFVDIPFLEIVNKFTGVEQMESYAKFRSDDFPQANCPWMSSYNYDELTNYHPCPCKNRCGKYGERYNWCWSKCRDFDTHPISFSWKYCSPYNPTEHQSSNFDYRGIRCKGEHSCGYHDYSYEWCYTEDNSWGYCSTDYDGALRPVFL